MAIANMATVVVPWPYFKSKNKSLHFNSFRKFLFLLFLQADSESDAFIKVWEKKSVSVSNHMLLWQPAIWSIWLQKMYICIWKWIINSNRYLCVFPNSHHKLLCSTTFSKGDRPFFYIEGSPCAVCMFCVCFLSSDRCTVYASDFALLPWRFVAKWGWILVMNTPPTSDSRTSQNSRSWLRNPQEEI